MGRFAGGSLLLEGNIISFLLLIMSVKLISNVENLLIGKRVVAMRYLSSHEARKLGFEYRPICLVFEDDLHLVLSSETRHGTVHFSEGDGLFVVGKIQL